MIWLRTSVEALKLDGGIDSEGLQHSHNKSAFSHTLIRSIHEIKFHEHKMKRGKKGGAGFSHRRTRDEEAFSGTGHGFFLFLPLWDGTHMFLSLQIIIIIKIIKSEL